MKIQDLQFLLIFLPTSGVNVLSIACLTLYGENMVALLEHVFL